MSAFGGKADIGWRRLHARKPQMGLWVTQRRGRRGLARRWGRWNFCKYRLVGGLQLSDLAYYQFLTGGELPDSYSHVAKLPLDSLLERGDVRLYLL